ncbi:helix-turn-helix domain-containing protein [Baekduia soli]|uniref:Helix-turn-helix domain-containing protein n=1 Tax=Baekduia soli TaxID=496014 RepID=A0A5B8U8P0_9ACTN|nr:helix-turn-helix domain-containing protein [Baekduia soli]QEC49360.1 helix-turn-helix domain-containing protein [Baekduia soli]
MATDPIPRRPVPSPPDEPSGLDELGRRIGRAVRALRLGLGWSLGDLARVAGLSKTILGRIERGEGNPSMETLWRLSQALSVPLGTLLSPPERPRTRRIPAREGEPLRAGSGMAAWLVHAEGREHRSEVFELALPAGADQRSEPHLPGTEELIVCLSGRLRVGPDGEEADLRRGDAAWFEADVAHHYAAARDARALCLMLYPSLPGAAGSR